MTHDNLGVVLDRENQLDEAIAEHRKAIDLDPKFASPHCNLGAILCDGKKHDYDGAIIELRQAIDLDPKYATAHNNLGTALSGKNRLDEAIAEYRKAIDLDPKYGAARERRPCTVGQERVERGHCRIPQGYRPQARY